MASVAGTCALAGWLAACPVASWLLLTGRLGERWGLLIGYLIVHIATTLASLAALRSTELREAMRAARVTGGEFARGLGLGSPAAGVCVGMGWWALGWKGLYLVLPALGATTGAWVAGRHWPPFDMRA
jgi:hypothetical protein